MQNLLNQKRIEETIQFIENQHQYLDEAKKELVDYVNYIKERKFEWNEQGSVDDKIKEIRNVLDKFGEVVSRRIKVTKVSDKLQENSEGIINKVNDVLKFTGK